MIGPTPERPWLVADVADTNARFGLIESRGAPPSRVYVLTCRDHGGLAEAAATYLARQAGDRHPVAACFALAGPVRDGRRYELAYTDWVGTSDELRAYLGVEHIELVNDFEAIALALPTLRPGDLRPIGDALPSAAAGPVAALGPGAGLGLAGLVPAGDGWVAVPSEGGLVDLPARTERELQLAALLQAEKGSATAADLLSGAGLARLHRLLAQLHGVPADPLTAAQICARRSDPLCGETLETFCALLGSFAGNVALTLGARGIYVGGGFLPRVADVLHRSAFRRRFESLSTARDYLRTVPTALIVSPTPALTGAATRLHSRLASPVELV